MAISDETLRHARDVAAEIVATHDAKYAPIFKILDDEIKRRDQQAGLLSDAKDCANALRQREMRRTRRRNHLAKGAQSS